MSSSSPKTVSVIVPAYNAAGTIERCVRALRELEPPATEIIVVDDASADDTADLAAQAGARVVRLSENVGPGLARNAGAEAARGEYLAFTDADCVAQSDWLAEHLRVAENEAWCASTGPYSGTSVDGLVPELMDLCLRFDQREMPEAIESAISSNFFVRRADFLAVGGFPEYRLPGARKPYWGNEDQELAHLLVRRTGKPVRWVPEGGPLHAYRSTWRGHFTQQARYAESILVSYARFPAMARTRANYSKSGGVGRLVATWLALPALAAPPAAAVCAVPFLVAHAPTVRFVAEAARSTGRRAALTAACYPFLFTTALAWTVGLAAGAVKGAAGFATWRREAPAR